MGTRGSAAPVVRRGVRVPRQQGRGPAGRFTGPSAAAPYPEQRSGVDEEVLDTPVVVRTPRPDAARSPAHRPRLLLSLHVAAVVAAGLVAAVVVRSPALLALTVVGLTLVTKFHAGRAAVRPGLPHLGRMSSDAALPLAVVSVAAAFGDVATTTLRDTVILVAAMTGVDAAGTLLRRRLARPLRVIVVGDHAGIGRATRLLSATPAARVIAGLLVNDRPDNPPLSTAEGVRVIRGVDEVLHWVDHWAADLVVVVPGPGLDSTSVRRLGWLLESGEASIAVMGLLDSVAPHRIDVTTLGSATLVNARSCRPSAFVRAAKWSVDRLAGLLLLLLAAPLLAVLWLCVRLESPGPGFFVQTRVGRDGSRFTMYKLRTMRCDAEAVKDSLRTLDDGNGVLFKMRADPRLTRLGRVLRRCSLDELPQLINVLRGDMSLVGPRPALPEEVATYDEVARRRLAVRPGLTGLWQVSGRSDLSWNDSVELDVGYTDNYRLADDLLIGLRTVGAVVHGRGAY